MDNDQPNMKMKIPITKSQHRNSVKENVKDYDSIFRNNAMWAARRLHEDPNYFINMNKSQSPKFNITFKKNYKIFLKVSPKFLLAIWLKPNFEN